MWTLVASMVALSSVLASSDVGGAIIYLMEWQYVAIGNQCAFLGEYGFGAVMISPPTENTVVTPNRPWHERYEPVSYKLSTRSGDEHQLRAMILKCHRHNISVIVDLVLNNMANTEKEEVSGTTGSQANPSRYSFPDFQKVHFNEKCKIITYNDPKQVRNCEVAGLADLDQSHPQVRELQVELMNKLIAMGVRGFMIDKAKFMWPKDLVVYQSLLNDVRWTEKPTRPFIVHNVEDPGTEAVKWSEYTVLGRVTDYMYGRVIGKYFTSGFTSSNISELKTLLDTTLVPREDALVFLVNVYSLVGKHPDVLMYQGKPLLYMIATALMLAYPHGVPLILSTYHMNSPYEETGVPTEDGSVVYPWTPGQNCVEQYNCEHRHPLVYKMVYFHKEVRGEEVSDWIQDSDKQFAFTLGNRGFIAFNLDSPIWTRTFKTTLPAGEYCEVFTDRGMIYKNGKVDHCVNQDSTVIVDSQGAFTLDISGFSFRAIHTWSKIGHYRGLPKDMQKKKRSLTRLIQQVTLLLNEWLERLKHLV